jgi:hypothetical protein
MGNAAEAICEVLRGRALPVVACGQPLLLTCLQNARCSRRLRLKLCYLRVVFSSKVQQPLLGKGICVFRQTAATLCLFFQGS